jgi:hypothetical protein
VKFDLTKGRSIRAIRFQLDLQYETDRYQAPKLFAQLILRRENEGFTHSLDRLWRELSSAQAESSTGYRRAVEASIALLAHEQVADSSEADAEARLSSTRARVSEWKTAIEPHHRIAAYETLDLSDKWTHSDPW